MGNDLMTSLSFAASGMEAQAMRLRHVSENIANADTPGYQARDFDFTAVLQNALSGRGQGGVVLATTSLRHIPGSMKPGDSGPMRLLYRQTTQPSADGNTVEMDVERAQFAENAFYYEAGLTFLTGRIRTMMTALQGQ